MNHIYIWGAGYYAEHVYSAIDRNGCLIKGIIDCDREKQGRSWKDSIRIYSPEQLLSLEYDYIILSMLKYESVEEQCGELGIPSEKVIAYWKDSESVGIFRSRAMEILKEQENTKKYKYRYDSAPYEWGLKEVPKIESAENLLRKIIHDRSSLCRFGDGEFEIMRGKDRAWFQKKSDALKNRLIEVINSWDDSINIAIAQNFIDFERYRDEAADEIRRYMAFETRIDVMKFLDMSRIYYDAYVTRPYYMYKDRKNADVIFPLFKEVWKKRNVTIVEGKYNRNGINNDLFDTAASIKRILCPSEDAWSKYDDIKKAVFDYIPKDDLVCIALGPTATVLAFDLAKTGYQAIDIGQVDNEYDWYVGRAKDRIPIKGKMVAEIIDNKEPEVFQNETYDLQIVAVIE